MILRIPINKKWYMKLLKKWEGKKLHLGGKWSLVLTFSRIVVVINIIIIIYMHSAAIQIWDALNIWIELSFGIC